MIGRQNVNSTNDKTNKTSSKDKLYSNMCGDFAWQSRLLGYSFTSNNDAIGAQVMVGLGGLLCPLCRGRRSRGLIALFITTAWSSRCK